MSEKGIKRGKTPKDKGRIVSSFAGIAKVSGLGGVGFHEILVDAKGKEVAIVIGFDNDVADVLFFDENYSINNIVYKSGQTFNVQVSKKILGRVVDGFGKERDGLGKIKGKKINVFRQAPTIIQRAPVVEPVTTGIKVIDITLPVGRGQRELIIGDRKLGKSTLVQDVVLNQKKAKKPLYCIYVSCGQKEQQALNMLDLFSKHNAFLYTTVVAATAGDSYAAQYLAPFVGAAIGEYFRDNGMDALVVYDDLTKHAKVYRDISLILKRAPGREAYPGEIFSLHAGLLERAAQLNKKNGGGSLTALPIIETQEGDITSFIPTNIISITDGQVYLENGLYQKGYLPAVNVGLSVSRVGSKAQPELLKEVVGGVRLSLAQHKEMQKLTALESTISKEAQSKIKRGDLMSELMKQDKHVFISAEEQILLFYLVKEGYFDDIEKSKWQQFEKLLLELVKNRYPNILKKIQDGKFTKTVTNKFLEIADDFKKEFSLDEV